MPTLTVRDLEPEVQRKLRIRAAKNHRSMEEEVRTILREAVVEDTRGASMLVDSIRERFARLGGVELELPPREPMRSPPRFR
jgi:antitoxin FitA